MRSQNFSRHRVLNTESDFFLDGKSKICWYMCKCDLCPVSEVYDSPALQAVQLEDGSTAFIQHAVQMTQPDTILAIQESDPATDLPLEGFADPETITVLEQYTPKVQSYHVNEIIHRDSLSNVLKHVLVFTDGRNETLCKCWLAHK